MDNTKRKNEIYAQWFDRRYWAWRPDTPVEVISELWALYSEELRACSRSSTPLVHADITSRLGKLVRWYDAHGLQPPEAGGCGRQQEATR